MWQLVICQDGVIYHRGEYTRLEDAIMTLGMKYCDKDQKDMPFEVKVYFTYNKE